MIPTRLDESCDLTLSSLDRQSYKNWECQISCDWDRRGAPWARNRGALDAAGTYILFSDNDIEWQRDALALMVAALETPSAVLPDRNGFTTDYAYGSYREIRDGKPGPVSCDEEWSYEVLKKRNFISTMSLIRRSAFPGWDESIPRLQDWDLWLTMAEIRSKGVYVGKQLFTTPYRKGITHGGGASYEEAYKLVQAKHGLA